MIDLELNKLVRVRVDLVDTLTKWILGSTVLFTIFLTITLVLTTQKKDPASKWIRFRNKLALLFSADVFYKVIQDSEQPSSSYRELINEADASSVPTTNEQQNHQKHSCYTQDILITSVFGKNNFYCLFILSLPLHTVMICLIILQKIFINEINLDSCASYMLSTRDEPYYYCRLMLKSFVPQTILPENITEYCHSTAINGTYNGKIDDIICIQYYFDKTKIIEIVTNIFVWQKISATVSVYLIRYFQFLFRRCFSCVSNNICLCCCIPILIILLNVSFVLIALIAYLILGNESTSSILTIDLIGAASATLIYVFISMNIYAWIVKDQNKYQPCMFQVGVTTYR
jgi:hypothetical protein